MSTAVEVVAPHGSPVHAHEGRPEPVRRDHVVVRAGRCLIGDRPAVDDLHPATPTT